MKSKIKVDFVTGQPILVTVLENGLKSKSGKVGSPSEKTSPKTKEKSKKGIIRNTCRITAP
jgi:hypothetical protein